MWEVLPATALTPVTFSTTLKTERNLSDVGEGEKQFSELWLAGLQATETIRILQ